jgi:hypothetical protein
MPADWSSGNLAEFAAVHPVAITSPSVPGEPVRKAMEAWRQADGIALRLLSKPAQK